MLELIEEFNVYLMKHLPKSKKDFIKNMMNIEIQIIHFYLKEIKY